MHPIEAYRKAYFADLQRFIESEGFNLHTKGGEYKGLPSLASKHYGSRIREWRLAQQPPVSVEELAKKCGSPVTKQLIAEIEGNTIPETMYVVRACRVAGIPLEFVGGV